MADILRLEMISVQPGKHWYCFEGSLGRLPRDKVEHLWAFLRAMMPPGEETGNFGLYTD